MTQSNFIFGEEIERTWPKNEKVKWLRVKTLAVRPPKYGTTGFNQSLPKYHPNIK
jgi:hypothetical protein